MVFNDFKKYFKIKIVIMDFPRKENEFSIYVYCFERISTSKRKKKD